MRHMAMRGGVVAVAVLALAIMLVSPPPSSASASVCAGDCNENGFVTIDEVVSAVQMALSARPPENCRAVDLDQSDSTSIEELISAVRAALVGCEGARTPA